MLNKKYNSTKCCVKIRNTQYVYTSNLSQFVGYPQCQIAYSQCTLGNVFNGLRSTRARREPFSYLVQKRAIKYLLYKQPSFISLSSDDFKKALIRANYYQDDLIQRCCFLFQQIKTKFANKIKVTSYAYKKLTEIKIVPIRR